ncbi:MAG: ankyrin repeat domain-containing protein [Desulfobulbaceae bacterium]|nr:ankyrin repeat domain-containing protein [Desulfobulbaceae bacterium]
MTMFLTKEEESRYAELQHMALDCARSGDGAMLESMVRAGMPVNLSDGRGNSLLMLAVYHGHEAAARMLIGYGAEIDRRNDHGQTPLGGAAFKGNIEMVNMLIEAGADVDGDNGGGRTPLMFAAMFGHREVVARLIRAGADTLSQTLFGVSAERIAGITGALRSLGSLFGR